MVGGDPCFAQAETLFDRTAKSGGTESLWLEGLEGHREFREVCKLLSLRLN
jgi:hypothetical protein